MHVKCQYCGTDCWDVEARVGHEVLCDLNPSNSGHLRTPVKGKAPIIASVFIDDPDPAHIHVNLARAVVVTGGKYKDKTVGDVEAVDYAYLAKYLVASTDQKVMDAAATVVGTHT